VGLDKWLKPDEVSKISKKKQESSKKVKKGKSEHIQNQIVEKQPISLSKYILLCTNAKCKYQKTIMKKHLNDNDKTCPKCNKIMKIKEV